MWDPTYLAGKERKIKAGLYSTKAKSLMPIFIVFIIFITVNRRIVKAQNEWRYCENG